MGKFFSSCYLIRNPYSYCVRVVVPADLRKKIGKTELRYSLRTVSLGEAKKRAHSISAFIFELFLKIRRNGDMEKFREISPDDIKKMVMDHVKRLLDLHEEMSVIFPVRVERRGYAHALTKLENSAYKDGLLKNDHSDVTHIADDILKTEGIILDPDSPAYKVLCREVLKGEILANDIMMKRELGDFEFELPYFPTKQTLPKVTAPDSIPFKDAVRKFIDGKNTDRGREWNPKTKDKFESSLGLAVEYFGNVLISEITNEKLREYRNALLKFPSNRNKRSQYKNLTIHDIIKMNIPKEHLLDITTINDHISRLYSLFEHAVVNRWGVPSNPVKDLKLVNPRANGKRKAFSSEQLTNLLRSTQYLNDEFQKPFHFWTPIIALFSGMRQNEIAQLYLNDIQEEDGIWFFRVEEDEQSDGNDKSVKTPRGWRDVPFHPILFQLNLHNYCIFLREHGEERLFPEISRKKYNYGDTVSRWFNANYKLKCGIPKNAKGLDYHSFRHTFINWFKQNILNSNQLKVVSEIVGHAVSKEEDELNPETMKRYGKEYIIKTKLEVISQLDYGIDLSVLNET